MHQYLVKSKSKKIEFNLFLYIIIIISIFRFVMLENYPNVPREEIGYFYKIPEGQTITYPKYPRNIKDND